MALAVHPMNHVRLHPFCGACGFPFDLNEHILAIYRTGHQLHVVNAGGYLRSADCEGVRFCHHSRCPDCRNVNETTTIHADCWNLFHRECTAKNKLFHLWTAALWRYPWRGQPSTSLIPSIPTMSLVDLAVEKGALPELRLPPEIKQLIWSQVPHQRMWCRFKSVLDLAQWIAFNEQSALGSVPLRCIDAWHRGQGPPPRSGGSPDVDEKKPFILLTMDAFGLLQIERVSADARTAHQGHVYSLIDVEECPSDASVLFFLGLSRVVLPLGCPGFYTWDTPTPPHGKQCYFFSRPPPPSSYITTIDIACCTGLTFFFAGGLTFAIHGHTQAAPSAMSTFAYLSPKQQEVVIWVYVPLPCKDRIEAFSVRRLMDASSEMFCFLFRMALAGDLLAGPWHRPENSSSFTCVGSPHTLMYDNPDSRMVSSVGIRTKKVFEEPVIIHPFVPSSSFLISPSGRSRAPLHDTFTPKRPCFSAAPLERALRVHVFEDGGTRHCRGILIEYESGAQRALGQCRIGRDRSQTYSRPSHICFAPRIQKHLPAKVKCISQPKVHSRNEPDWECFKMEGVLHCRTVNDEMHFEIVTSR